MYFYYWVKGPMVYYVRRHLGFSNLLWLSYVVLPQRGDGDE